VYVDWALADLHHRRGIIAMGHSWLKSRVPPRPRSETGESFPLAAAVVAAKTQTVSRDVDGQSGEEHTDPPSAWQTKSLQKVYY
jgi:hypothetical protein